MLTLTFTASCGLHTAWWRVLRRTALGIVAHNYMYLESADPAERSDLCWASDLNHDLELHGLGNLEFGAFNPHLARHSRFSFGENTLTEAGDGMSQR